MRKNYYKRTRRYRRRATARFFLILVFFIVALGTGAYFIISSLPNDKGAMHPANNDDDVKVVIIPKPDTEDPTNTPGETPGETSGIKLSENLKPYYTEDTDPQNFGFKTDVMYDGEEVDDEWKSESDIYFGLGKDYTEVEGVITFRGNNYRDAPSYGYADIISGSEKLTLINTKTTSRVSTWGGSGWTGQPLVVKWQGKTLKNMDDMFLDGFKGREELIEVIIPSLDGNIYFMELSTGKKTRNFIYSGGPTKGTASLDPRGYPILYVGQGLEPDGIVKNGQNIYFRAFDLTTGERIMRVGATSADPFALRTNWQAYDSSPLIDADTDTLIWPGENGVIYVCELETSYNEETGEVSMAMDPVKAKYRYTSDRNDLVSRWGIEDSIVAWRNYMIFTDNIGMLQCIDMNTLKLVYANDLLDDSDVSMVLEEDIDADTFYLYTGCEYDEKVRELGSTGTAYARKIDGLTGEIIWEKDFEVFATDVDGGVLASPVLGREGTSMAGLIIYNITFEVTGDGTSIDDSTSRLVALDKLTGSIVWEYDMDYPGWSCSSPVPVYTEDGRGYIVQCDRAGDIALIRVDGQSAEEVAKINVEDNFEATPVVYENMIVVGSRKDHFFYIEMG